jgi:hypothetical protein
MKTFVNILLTIAALGLLWLSFDADRAARRWKETAEIYEAQLFEAAERVERAEAILNTKIRDMDTLAFSYEAVFWRAYQAGYDNAMLNSTN